jgi:HTH-type transcriptional regulator/antitoxin HigA
MAIKPIRDERDYEMALAEIARLMELDPEEGTEDLDTLDVLATLVDAYETAHYPLDPLDPIDAINYQMRELSLSQRQLAAECGIAESKISEVLNRKRALSLPLIRELSRVLRLPISILGQPYRRERAA